MAKKKMTAEEFVEHYSGAPYEREKLARIASDVEGVVGAAAKAWLAADALLDEALKSVDYEEG